MPGWNFDGLAPAPPRNAWNFAGPLPAPGLSDTGAFIFGANQLTYPILSPEFDNAPEMNIVQACSPWWRLRQWRIVSDPDLGHLVFKEPGYDERHIGARQQVLSIDGYLMPMQDNALGSDAFTPDLPYRLMLCAGTAFVGTITYEVTVIADAGVLGLDPGVVETLHSGVNTYARTGDRTAVDTDSPADFVPATLTGDYCHSYRLSPDMRTAIVKLVCNLGLASWSPEDFGPGYHLDEQDLSGTENLSVSVDLRPIWTEHHFTLFLRIDPGYADEFRPQPFTSGAILITPDAQVDYGVTYNPDGTVAG